jgi:hypothetical protein
MAKDLPFNNFAESSDLKIKLLSNVIEVNGPLHSKCLFWAGARLESGYGRIWWKTKAISTHRASWEAHNGPIPDGLCVLHHCDNPPCINPSHLFLGTMSDNSADMVAKGRRRNTPLFGDDNPHAQLTKQQVMEIKWLLANVPGMSLQVIANKYNVTKSAVNHIKHGRGWEHVTVLVAPKLNLVRRI